MSHAQLLSDLVYMIVVRKRLRAHKAPSRNLDSPGLYFVLVFLLKSFSSLKHCTDHLLIASFFFPSSQWPVFSWKITVEESNSSFPPYFLAPILGHCHYPVRVDSHDSPYSADSLPVGNSAPWSRGGNLFMLYYKMV